MHMCAEGHEHEATSSGPPSLRCRGPGWWRRAEVRLITTRVLAGEAGRREGL